MANIAPTPWVFDDESGCIRSLHGNAIAYLSRVECRENPGMQPLLTHAPDLLATLKECAEYMGEPMTPTPGNLQAAVVNTLIRNIRAAIARAEGGGT